MGETMDGHSGQVEWIDLHGISEKNDSISKGNDLHKIKATGNMIYELN